METDNPHNSHIENQTSKVYNTNKTPQTIKSEVEQYGPPIKMMISMIEVTEDQRYVRFHLGT